MCWLTSRIGVAVGLGWSGGGSAPVRRVWSVGDVRALGVRTDLVTAGEILGIGRTVAHQLARQGTFPTTVLRVGHKYVVPVAPLLELLGVSGDADPVEATDRGLRAARRRGPGHR